MSTFTNTPSFKSTTIAVSPSRKVYSPYVSQSGKMSNLTDKERAARKLTKLGSFGGGGMNTSVSSQSPFFSPQLSTDFLELPQSLRERRELFRHFYDSDPIVGQAIDLHTELPLSKIRLAKPTPRTCPSRFKSPEDYANYILAFFSRMVKRIKLFQRLITATHHYHLDGNVFIFAEDGTVEVPAEVGQTTVKQASAVLADDGTTREVVTEESVDYEDREDRELAYYQRHYKGWDKIIILPIDQVALRSMTYTDKVKLSLIPSDRDRALIAQASAGDEEAMGMVQEIPPEVRDYIETGKLIPLGTDPDEGSFCYHLKARAGSGEELGASILNRCLRDLMYREKLRQAQTQIASRAMTPKRLVWGENLSEGDTEDLREQVDLALVDPDYSIVTNYEVHWEEIGARDRLLDLSGEYEITDKHLYAGLGVTESILTGESTFSGDRVKLEVLNTKYVLFREVIQEYVEENLFKPVARRKGFVELDEWGEEEVVLYPRLSFTRLALRDSQDTFDALLNLYQKGSLSIDVILELFNIDPVDTKEKIERDMFTVNDALFNEVIRGIYGEVGRGIAEKTDIMAKIAAYLKLEVTPEAPAEAEGRF